MPRASIQNARPALHRLQTRPSRIVQSLLRRLLPLLFRSQGLALDNDEAAQSLAKAFSAQQNGDCNLLIAFRHPSTRDPLVLADLFWNQARRYARRLNQPLPRRVELRFLYDRGIPIWAGPQIGWLLQRCGGIAIHRGRLDRPALAQARQTLAQGRYPLVVAPEGATNNLSGEMAPLEPGVAQLAFWAAEDMERAGESKQLIVLPVCLHYSWRRQDWTALDQRLLALEAHLGLTDDDPARRRDPMEQRRQRLTDIGAALMNALEQLERLRPEQDLPLSDRIRAYRLHGLRKAESHFCLNGSGSLQERCRRIEQAAWDRIYREGVDQLPPLERSLADWEAREADLQLTRMRLVEHFTGVSGHYVADQPDFDRFGEMLLLVEEAIAWIEDRPWKAKPGLGPQRVELSVADPISIRERLGDYRNNRRQTVDNLTEDLATVLTRMMRNEVVDLQPS